jgi:hypothetical protein
MNDRLIQLVHQLGSELLVWSFQKSFVQHKKLCFKLNQLWMQNLPKNDSTQQLEKIFMEKR